MRIAALTFVLFVASVIATNAQRFSLLPQVGFENSKTTISYNDLRSGAPLGVKFTPQGSLRLNYASKQGHGFFVGAATSRHTISYNFTDLETGMTNFSATAGNMQVRLEGGYQFNSKAISLNKSGKSSSKKNLEAKKKCETAPAKSGCRSSESYSSRCGSSKTKQPALAKNNKGSWMRIQPSIGMGFIPSVRNDVVTKVQNAQTTYDYRAGNWNTAVIAGTGFEFGRKNTRLFTVSINYYKGLGNLNTETISTQSSTKNVTATLNSATSGWDLRVGIPFSLGGPKAAKKPKTQKKPQMKRSCGQSRIIYRCSGY
jgi:hypothetical protein